MTSGDFAALTNSSLSLRTIGSGVPSGATIPCQTSSSVPGKPASVMVGTSGMAGERFVAVQPSTRNLPPCTWPIADTRS